MIYGPIVWTVRLLFKHLPMVMIKAEFYLNVRITVIYFHIFWEIAQKNILASAGSQIISQTIMHCKILHGMYLLKII